jgi:hypothetical protein
MNLLTASVLFDQFASDASNRYDLSEPFVKSGYLWATDGRICVRYKTAESDTVPKGEKNILDPSDTFRQFKMDGDFVVTDKSYTTVPCWACGECGHCCCEVCSGADDDDVVCDCDCCNGSGTVHFPREVKIGSATVATKYDVLMRTLPNLRIAIPQPGEELNPISFVFDGGEGLLMPLDVSKA